MFLTGGREDGIRWRAGNGRRRRGRNVGSGTCRGRGRAEGVEGGVARDPSFTRARRVAFAQRRGPRSVVRGGHPVASRRRRTARGPRVPGGGVGPWTRRPVGWARQDRPRGSRCRRRHRPDDPPPREPARFLNFFGTRDRIRALSGTVSPRGPEVDSKGRTPSMKRNQGRCCLGRATAEPAAEARGVACPLWTDRSIRPHLARGVEQVARVRDRSVERPKGLRRPSDGRANRCESKRLT